MKDYRKEFEKWIKSPALSQVERAELLSVKDDDAEIESRFFAPLAFGTAGLRGIMGAGINRMNVHVIRQATQGFANVIKAEGKTAMEKGVVICFDCRENSSIFAREAACVMAGNGISVRLFESLRPTPELSFAIRHYGAAAGINITASHNPKEYNGYKVYWDDGAQLPPEHASAVAEEIEKIDIFDGIISMDYDTAVKGGLISVIGEETDELFLNKVLSQAINRKAVEEASDDLRIVYTPFHGAGYKLVPEALKRLGIKHLYPVPEQMITDGSFPTVRSPNPEEAAGFYLAIALAQKKDAGLIIGTDPDADRVGVMVRGRDGAYVTVSGNQMGVLLLDYIISAKKALNSLPDNAAALKTIVTTDMARAVCEKNGVEMTDTFTGFKFMAEKIKEFGDTRSVIFSYEESYGYMMGDYVRDKDAVTASMMIAEMAAYYHNRSMTLLDAIRELYKKYGYFAEKTLNLVMPGIDGLKKMSALMESLRSAPPEVIGGSDVLYILDYDNGSKKPVNAKGEASSLLLKGSNVLCFELSDGTKFIVRPSGTEPKIKIYILARGLSESDCSERIEKYESFAEGLKN